MHVVKGQTIKDTPVGNMLVPKGAAVIALLHGTMHDPTIFPDPDECVSKSPRKPYFAVHLTPLAPCQCSQPASLQCQLCTHMHTAANRLVHH